MTAFKGEGLVLRGVNVWRDTKSKDRRRNLLHMNLQLTWLVTKNWLLNICHLSDKPSLTTVPTDQTIIEDAIAAFHCVATGNPKPKITWIKDGVTVTTGNPLSLQAKRDLSGKYWCSADNGLNSTVNASAYLDVQCKYMPRFNRYTQSNILECHSRPL